MSAPPRLGACPLAWFPAPFVFGEGLYADGPQGTIELIPYVSEDGSGKVAGWSVWVDRRCLGRHPGPIEVAMIAAEARGWPVEAGGHPPADPP